ncbi:Uncharacterised protein [Vibrio cholerae]|nr:hypothetical protein VCSRO154_3258 [Vibrio metoecus]CSA97860.1 Uncharacterised protein [Vibrio cholerae]CSD81659.1 Uncharacterised protein [Vibrio cholerae]
MNIQDVTAVIDFITVSYIFVKSHPYYIQLCEFFLHQQ